MDGLSAGTLDWSLNHLIKFGDTDIFPVPFEYEAIRANWTDVQAHLMKVDLAAHETHATFSLLTPKVGYGFRVVNQLHPYDCLLYTGMIRECAELAEAFRVPKEKRIACSYRVRVTPEGELFEAGVGWKEFQDQTTEYLSLKESNFVITADIADFYNQTYHHRIQNALSGAGVSDERSKNIEHFLGNITARQSRGVPVGPSGSIVLAEACLTDVDNFLMRKGYIHTRYVDDFRIFVETRREAIQVLHDLTEYLYTAHRLCLQGSKTGIYPRESFNRFLVEPEHLETARKTERIRGMIAEATESSFYGLFPSEEEIKEIEIKGAREAIEELFKEVIDDEKGLGIVRYVLRKARALRTRIILPEVLGHLDRLVPAFRETIAYIGTVFPRANPKPTGAALTTWMDRSEFGRLPIIQAWFLELITKYPQLIEERTAFRLAENAPKNISDRYTALIAKAYGAIDWVRSKKESWAGHAPWARTAIVWAGTILPRDEALHWLKPITANVDHLVSVVAKSASGAIA
jgi:hypothetical protein